MILTVIAGILTGFIVSIPPLGPISFALISKGFNNRVKEGMTIAFGAAFMDFVYCMIAFGGISLIISLLPNSVGEFYSVNFSMIQVSLTFFGCLVVIVYGIKILRTKVSFKELEYKQSEKIITAKEKVKAVEEKAKELVHHHKTEISDKSNHTGMFLMGVMLCLSSVTLPASWIAFVGYLKSYRVISSSFTDGLLFSSGAFIGTALWFYTLLKLITGNKHRINPSTVNKLNITAGIILILLGIILFIKATQNILY